MGSHQNGTEMGTLSIVFTSLLEEVVHSMLSKIVSLACMALTAGQVQIEGSPEWQAYKNAELAHIAPSIGPLASVGRNFAQEQLDWQQQQLIHQQNALNFVASGAGRRKRQVRVEGSPEWQAYKNAELAFIAPSVGPTPVSYAQSALNFIGPAPGPTPENYAQAALDFVGPAPGPTPLNYAQSALDFVAPAPVSHAQALLNYQQEALNFVAGK